MSTEPRPASAWHTIVMVASMFVIGFGIGWLMGLAVSPVASTVIASVTGAAAAIVSAFSGMEDKAHRVNPVPIAITILGLLAGSIVGIWFRNADVLGRDLVAETKRWQASGLEMEQKAIIARFFDLQYPATATGDASPSPVPHSNTYLFGIGTDECLSLRSLEGEALQGEMSTSTHAEVRALAAAIEDPAVLAKITQEVLCPAGP